MTIKHKVFNYIIKKIKKIIIKIENKFLFADDNEQLFISLAPKVIKDESELVKINPYLDNLRKAINTENINNIAITGSYGSGKSTILKTFQYHNTKYKFLNISLASFKDNKESDDSDRKLEVSILQQIFYHVEPNRIPDSRFKRIINLTNSELVAQTIFVVIWIASTLILFKFNNIDKLNPQNLKMSLPVDWLSVMFMLIFFTGIGQFVKKTIRLFTNSKISKFNIKGEVELGEANEKSVFNQHLEEILYFFERTKFNVVIIEDLDRFKSTDIFTKLREINILINNSNLIERKVTFVYAIKDELFNDSNERVKFFEFIIPVIPFINPSNAGEQLTRLITASNLDNEISSDFIEDVTTFINDIDMRLLINIFQEFLIYRKNLISVINYNELFAIIIYKNLFPEDFGDLSKGRGKLFEFFSKKVEYTNSLIAELNYRINELEIENSNIDKENISSIKELRQVYISEIIAHYSNVSSINGIEIRSLIEDDNFNALLNNNENITIQFFVLNNNLNSYDKNFKELDKNFTHFEEQVNARFSYLERVNNINSKLNNKIEFNKSEIENLRKQRNSVQLLTVREIFINMDSDDYLSEFKDNYLMRNLLINGYINENYSDYISIFHEVNITKADFEFLRKVKSGVSLPFEFELTKTEKLIKRLEKKYFYREDILNYYLLDELIINEPKYSNKYKLFFNLLNNDSKKIFQFILGYIDRKETNIPLFLNELLNKKENFITYIFTKSNLPDDRIKELITLIFNNVDEINIYKQSGLYQLTDWFNNVYNFSEFSLAFNNVNKLQSFVKNQNVLINQLVSPNGNTNDTFSFIVKNNLYLISTSNLNVILKWYNSTISDSEFQTQNFSLMLSLMPEYFLNNIKANINIYVKNVLLNLPENKNEAENSIIELLNYETLSNELKADFIQKQYQKITTLSSIERISEKMLVMSYNKVQATWNNIFEYYDCQEGSPEFDKILIDFFNYESNHKSLANNKLSVVYDKNEEYIKAFSQKIIYCNLIEHASYTNLLRSIPYQYDTLNFEKLDSIKIHWLINNKFVVLNQLNLEELRKINGKLAVNLIEVNESTFIENFDEFSLENNDWLLLIKSDYFSYEGKLRILGNLDEMTIIEDIEIADAVCSILPSDRLIPLKYEVLEAMFIVHKSVQKRIEILNLHFESLDVSQIRNLIEKIGNVYARMFVSQNRPSITNESYNLILVEKLRLKDLISSYNVNNVKNEIRVVAKYNVGY